MPLVHTYGFVGTMIIDAKRILFTPKAAQFRGFDHRSPLLLCMQAWLERLGMSVPSRPSTAAMTELGCSFINGGAGIHAGHEYDIVEQPGYREAAARQIDGP